MAGPPDGRRRRQDAARPGGAEPRGSRPRADRRVLLEHVRPARQAGAGRAGGLLSLSLLGPGPRGDDPQHGYEENNMFYHPDMKFQFSVPQNWKLYNTPSQVQIMNQQKDAAIIFALGQGSTHADVASNFISNSGATVVNRENIRVNGLQAQKVLLDVASQNDVIRVLSYFISMDKYIFIFQGMSAKANYGNYQSIFSTTLGSFRRLTDQRKINIQPDHIRVRTVKNGGTLSNVLRNLGVKPDELEQIALMNGKHLSDQVEVNTLLKVVEKSR